MHVLSISPHFSVNGVTVHVEGLNERLFATGHRVTWVPLSTESPRIVERAGDREQIRALQRQADDDWFREKLQLVDAAVEQILSSPALNPAGDTPVDLIHSHDWLAGLAGRRLAPRLGCPHLTTIHTLTELQRHRAGLPGRLPPHAGQIGLEKELCSSPDAILTVSEEMRRLIRGVAPASMVSIDVIANGVPAASEPEAETVDELRRRLAPNGERLVLFVGRLAPQKGLDFLLRSSFDVRAQRPDTRWVIVGDHIAAHMMRPVYDRILEEGKQHITFEGEVPRSEVETYYRAADCLVVPSLYEGCPYVILEGMRAGIPIVASDIPCFREILDDRRTGLLVPLDKASDTRGPRSDLLAHAQLEVLGDPELGAHLAGSAGRDVRQRFPLDQHLDQTFEIYERMVRGSEQARNSL